MLNTVRSPLNVKSSYSVFTALLILENLKCRGLLHEMLNALRSPKMLNVKCWMLNVKS